MKSMFVAPALAAIGFAAGFAPAFAQDGKGDETKPSPPPEKADAAELLKQMEFLYPKALNEPKSDGQSDDPKVVAERAKALDEWRAAVRRLAKTGDDYLAALGGAAPDARALYFRGVGKCIAGKVVGVNEKKDCYAAACDSLQRFLDGTDEKSAYRTDAEMRLGTSLVCAERLDDAVVHLRRAVDLLQKDGRHDDAGECAYAALVELKSHDRSKEMLAFADAVHAADADFGGSTPTIRLFAASRLAVGSPLPPLPKVTDLDDKPISFAPGGAPLLVHFFYTAMVGVRTERKSDDVDKQIRPLWDAYHAKGLRIVGVCMDQAITPAAAEAMRKKWEDWGTKGEFRDGSPASCREWMKKHSVEWTVRCSGLWTEEPVSKALGGVAPSDPYAVLVDKDGVVRWMGDPVKAEGLADEAAKLFK